MYFIRFSEKYSNSAVNLVIT